jgi:flavin reductase (DIM6/NTAB) family NADH-FMN oxidoreductase RutF
MFYKPEDGHGLPHNPFNALVTPRPIGWISTRDAAGRDNLAPYSFFNAVAYVPPQVMFASTSAKEDRGDTKDSVANIRETGVFCCNIVPFALRDAMNVTTEHFAAGIDEWRDDDRRDRRLRRLRDRRGWRTPHGARWRAPGARRPTRS